MQAAWCGTSTPHSVSLTLQPLKDADSACVHASCTASFNGEIMKCTTAAALVYSDVLVRFAARHRAPPASFLSTALMRLLRAAIALHAFTHALAVQQEHVWCAK
eukprot:3977-Heterococcus_DN1.PRE.2